jgi:hypothetical protein
MSSGLVRYASAPAARRRSTAVRVASAVITTTGIAAVPAVGAQPPQHLLARDVREVEVEEDQVGEVLARELHPEPPCSAGVVRQPGRESRMVSTRLRLARLSSM